ncbi:YkgJ family cysteine cluster protein [Rhizobium leguminosarum]|uniref:YkgJ family cysteine cluster protein n=1 Tax=Rhizobium leguminosarum TaxID=384 RepID=UPI001319E04D|nr:YkgJ family cysteine cluster protein [Rhizobium leguminosarum]
MGEAKRKKEAAAVKAARAKRVLTAIEEVGIPIPTGMEYSDPRLVDAARTAGKLLDLAFDVMEKSNARANSVPVMTGLAMQLHGNLDYLLDHIVNNGGSPVSVGCHEGCAWCCHQNVEVSILEAILIAVETAHDERGTKFDERSQSLLSLSDRERAVQGEPCPFLDDRNKCSIYKVRPVACRSYLAPDPRQCESSFRLAKEGHESETQFYAEPQISGTAFKAVLDAMAFDFGYQHDLVDLVSTVATIRKDPSIIERWLSGEKVFEPKSHDSHFVQTT